MSVPNQALQKLLQEIEAQAIASQQQINVVKTQIAAKQRDIRLTQLTSTELDQVPTDTKIYEGVGKMFVSLPVPDVKKRLGSERDELNSDISSLNKKLHYLETTHQKSMENINHILSAGGRA